LPFESTGSISTDCLTDCYVVYEDYCWPKKDISELTGKANAFAGFLFLKRIINT
jgi:hypothetical protein